MKMKGNSTYLIFHAVSPCLVFLFIIFSLSSFPLFLFNIQVYMLNLNNNHNKKKMRITTRVLEWRRVVQHQQQRGDNRKIQVPS